MLRYLKGNESKEDNNKLEKSLKQRHQLTGQWYNEKVLSDKKTSPQTKKEDVNDQRDGDIVSNK